MLIGPYSQNLKPWKSWNSIVDDTTGGGGGEGPVEVPVIPIT